MNGETMIAWAMNGTDIPFLNGYPIKLIVPGYFGTYWVKHLSEIEVIGHDFDGFFMNTAYRVPDNDCQCIPAGSSPDKMRPITQLKIRSFITSLRGGETVRLGDSIALQGIAFDGGNGISAVEISDDGGRQWQPATIGADLGKYSFREWRTTWKPQNKGKVALQVRARNRIGEQQPASGLWNPGGYAHNAIETIAVSVV
jgi:DMSO/TMAO reductase YedYZ molybdopterin-dependent catalytic subunit